MMKHFTTFFQPQKTNLPVSTRSRQRFLVLHDMSPTDARALGDPFVRGLHDFGQVVVGDLRISTVVTGVALVGGTRWIGDVMGL